MKTLSLKLDDETVEKLDKLVELRGKHIFGMQAALLRGGIEEFIDRELAIEERKVSFSKGKKVDGAKV